ncbi:amino acid adenylation domain-containing protein [Streptomyces qinglanensis]|uniref:amino acid adenylation domain-containing protein n=1 Tax=Streptomyces qinglanensis TaxID=943816 RepID=UPI003787F976
MTGPEAGQPLSFAQERLWLLDQLRPGQAGYLTPLTYRVEGPLDTAALQAALRDVAERHPVLRCRFAAAGGEPYAVVEAAAGVRLECEDLAREPAPELAAERRIRDRLSRPLDLRAAPPLRALVLRLSAHERLFHLHIHHIAFDGLSRPVLERELSAAYAARTGEAAPAPSAAPAFDYFAHARAQRRALEGAERERLLRYWREQLADVPTVLTLPADRPRPARPTGSGAEADLAVPAAATRALRQVAEAHRTSLFTVTLAVYQELLGRYTHSDRMVLGTPFSGRTEPGTEEAIGFFTHTVVLRGDLRGRPSLAALSTRVRDAVWDAADHQDLPFEMLVDELDAAGAADGHPLVQHWFDVTDTTLTGSRLELAGTRIRPVGYPETATRFETELHLEPSAAGLRGRLVYSTDLFDPPRMRDFAMHYRQLLETAAARPEVPLAGLPLLGPREQAELVAHGSGPACAAPERGGAHATVPAMFVRQAAERPADVAVADGAAVLDYGRLHARARAVAAQVVAHGGRPEEVVAVFLPRGSTLVCAALGAMLAGCCYLLLDPAQPPERIRYLLADSGARLVLTDPATRKGLPVPDAPTGPRTVGGQHSHQDPPAPVVLDATSAADATGASGGPASAGAGGSEPFLPGPEPLHAAYLVYTSGSTGRPKPVAVTHAGLAHLVAWHLAHHPVEPAARTVAQVAGVSFDAAAWEIWPALAGGARLEICPEETVRDPEALVAHLAASGATSVFAPTPLAEQLIRHPLGTATRLTRLLTGGDVFRPRGDDAPGVPVVNHYGPTENTVVATATTDLGPGWEDTSLGRPITGVRAYVVDENLQLVPPGVPGELCLAGAGLARGYRGRPALTAELFVPDPFGGPPGARMYRTGDLVAWRADGALDFLGRRDTQVKISGHRIEPGEVEAALLSCPQVREATVAAVRGPAGQSVLAAYVVPHGAPPDPRDLRTRLQTWLPPYAVPALFVPLEALPLTPSGKVDRAALPEPRESAAALVAPRGPLEEEVLRLWREVFPATGLGVTSDFFSAGGTSLAASRLAARIRNCFDVDFPVRAVFDHRTVADQCADIERRVAQEIARMTEEEIEYELGE